jgi:hypothetical protein
LRNRRYPGHVEFEGELIRAQHDATVSDVLFEKCKVKPPDFLKNTLQDE